MSSPAKIAILGFWHVHAAGYAEEVRAAGADVVAGWDADPELGAAEAAALGIRFEPDLDALLGDPAIDGVVITTATADHTEVISRAIAAGKHVFTEKLLAPTVEECERLLRLAEEAGVVLHVSLPRLAEAITLAAVRELDAGRLGELTYVRVRMAHDGWIAGWLPERFADPVAAVGGAFSDLGCHPAYLVQRLLGAEPERVTATYTRVTGRAVEDNAVVTMAYPGGAIGVAEASFVTTPGAAALEVRGTLGSLLSGLGQGGVIAKGEHYDPEVWTPLELPDEGVAPVAVWFERIRTGAADAANARAALDLTRVVVEANRAAAR